MTVDKFNNLYDLLKNGTRDEIKNILPKMVYNIGVYCSTYFGQGSFGTVSAPAFGPIVPVKIGEETIYLAIVVKESKVNTGIMYFNEYLDNLILSSDLNLTTEGIMLYILSKCWYDGTSLHMPVLVGTGACDLQRTGIITHLIIEKCGLDTPIELTYTNRLVEPTANIFNLMFTKMSYVSTVQDLCDYINLNYDDDYNCVLPNKNKIHYPDIIDNLTIFYLHTSAFLWNKFGMVLSDQHPGNIFVHWLNEYSRCGKKNISEIEYICYNIGNNKYLKVPTCGFIYKIGDIGCCIMNIQKNVTIIGNSVDNDAAYLFERINMYKTNWSFYMEMISTLFGKLPYCIIIKTKIYKIIMNNNKLNKFVPGIGFDKNLDIPTELELLNSKEFESMIINKPIDTNENKIFVIEQQ